jgi:uracil-DNA glycosylase
LTTAPVRTREGRCSRRVSAERSRASGRARCAEPSFGRRIPRGYGPRTSRNNGVAGEEVHVTEATAPLATTPVRHVRELERRIAACTACDLHQNRTRTVPGEGPTDARLVLVGVAPRRQEDLQGRPFSGAARNVLDNALLDVGLDVAEIRITSLIRCRPPRDRQPTSSEVQACSSHLDVELRLIEPEVIVSFGALATAVLYGRSLPIEKVSGYRLSIHQDVTLIPTYHPVDAVRGVPQAAAALRRDLAAAKGVLDGRLRTGAQVLQDLRSRATVGT